MRAMYHEEYEIIVFSHGNILEKFTMKLPITNGFVHYTPLTRYIKQKYGISFVIVEDIENKTIFVHLGRRGFK
ncbi:MAG: hypothetical protein DRO40_06645 [Thermoprotei archaeon]|nr:MAG: hypothetical protein DRO40_06645 [Thermoprotei archaeon]